MLVKREIEIERRERNEEDRKTRRERETKGNQNQTSLLLQSIDSLLPESPDLTTHGSRVGSECKVAGLSAILVLVEVEVSESFSEELKSRKE